MGEYIGGGFADELLRRRQLQRPQGQPSMQWLARKRQLAQELGLEEAPAPEVADALPMSRSRIDEELPMTPDEKLAQDVERVKAMETARWEASAPERQYEEQRAIEDERLMAERQAATQDAIARRSAASQDAIAARQRATLGAKQEQLGLERDRAYSGLLGALSKRFPGMQMNELRQEASRMQDAGLTGEEAMQMWAKEDQQKAEMEAAALKETRAQEEHGWKRAKAKREAQPKATETVTRTTRTSPEGTTETVSIRGKRIPRQQIPDPGPKRRQAILSTIYYSDDQKAIEEAKEAADALGIKY